MYPILLSVGPLKIYSFGVFLALATIIGAFTIWREGRQAKPERFDEEKLVDLILVEALFGLIGARICYLILHFEDFGFDFFRWLLIFHFPGLDFIGAIVGGVVGALVFAKKMGWSFCQVGDFLVLGISLGEVIGRIGAFLSGSAYGKLTTLPWGVPMVGLIGRRHPVQIYEAIVALLVFIILWRLKILIANKKLQAGFLFLVYFLLFGVTKLFIEFFRGDSVYFDGWRVTQIVCLVFIVTAVILLYKRLGRSVKTDILAIVRKVRYA